MKLHDLFHILTIHMYLIFFILQKYFIDLIENIYQRTSSFENKSDDDPLTGYLRVEVMTFACRLGYSDCITKSVALFDSWMNATDPDKENL